MNFLKTLKCTATPSTLRNSGYLLRKQIGEGIYGKIYHCELSKQKSSFACKVTAYEEADGLLEIEEYYILSTFIHPHLPLLQETFLPVKHTPLLIHVMQLGICNLEHASKQNMVNTNHVIPILSQVASALSFLHDNHCLHLDIKPENILIMKLEGKIEVKLIDFSISMCHVENMKHGEISYYARVSANFRPLEAFFDPNTEKKRFGYYTDVWSFGILGLYILSMTTPTPMSIFNAQWWTEQDLKKIIAKETSDKTLDKLFNDVWNNKIPFASELKQVLQSCFIMEPLDRPTIQEIYAEPFLFLGKKGELRKRKDNGVVLSRNIKQAETYQNATPVLYGLCKHLFEKVTVNTLCIALELYHYVIPFFDSEVHPIDIVITCFMIAAKLSFRSLPNTSGFLELITDVFVQTTKPYIQNYIKTYKTVKANRILPIELKITSLVNGIFYTNHHYDLLNDQADVCIYFSICFSPTVKDSYYDFNQELLEKYRNMNVFEKYKHKSKLDVKISTLPHLLR